MPGPVSKYSINLTESQLRELENISVSYMLSYCEVQRAKILLLAHKYPRMSNKEIGIKVGCGIDAVKNCRKRWYTEGRLKDHPRKGKPRRFTPTQRAQIIAIACSKPGDYGKPWRRWSGEKLAQVAKEKKIVDYIGASTIRDWLRQDEIKPWRYQSWQKSTDPEFVEKATPVLDLYEKANDLSKKK